MLENFETEAPRGRLLRSARVLRAYFEHRLNLKLELLTEAPTGPLDAGMQFDTRISQLGVWGLRSNAPIAEKQQSEISATFHGVLGALDNLEDRRRELVFIQERLTLVPDELPSNVIPLRRSLAPKAGPFSSVRDKRWHLRLDCLIESSDTSEIHKMAFELHSQSERYAFVEYKDLDRNCRLNLSEMQELGVVSIFIPSILDLTGEEQRVLRELMQTDSSHRPLLMVGANVPYSDLRAEPTIDLEFLVLLSRAYIKLTRPFREYKEQGLIHFFLDSLST